MISHSDFFLRGLVTRHRCIKKERTLLEHPLISNVSVCFAFVFPYPVSHSLSTDLIRYGRPVEAGLQSIVTSMLLSGTGTSLRLVTILSWISRHKTLSIQSNLGSEKSPIKNLWNFLKFSETLFANLKSSPYIWSPKHWLPHRDLYCKYGSGIRL